MPFEILDPVAFEARDHEDRVKAAHSRELIGESKEALAAHQIDLVQDEDRRPVSRGEAVQDPACIAIDAAGGIDQQRRLVRILRARPGRRYHRPVEAPTRSKDARCIDIDDLRSTFDGDAEQPGPRRLRLRRNDRELMADEAVEQGRLAGIRRADQRNIAAPRRRRLCLCHELRLRGASPSRRPRHGWRTKPPSGPWRGGRSPRGSRSASGTR